ncbi:hypothetical protein DL96DRAFT_1600806 [Flagelloscypha sp. PMI_526]|nr:hypothetical protein DL96DRAFT_1600806 [Flagelloscypha sp. PMI_526]
MSIGHSPKSNPVPPHSPGSSSIPTLKTLRSLLPFGPSKSNASPPSSKSRFSAFDGVRRSIQRERPLSNDLAARNQTSLHIQRPDLNVSSPIISIGPSPQIRTEDVDEEPLSAPRKRSISLSGLRPSESVNTLVPPPESSPEADSLVSSPIPSPGPATPEMSLPSLPPPTDLSTIIEADTSGISKHLPSPSPSPGPNLSRENSVEFDLPISSSELRNEVLEAMRNSESAGSGQPSRTSWLGPKPGRLSLESDGTRQSPTLGVGFLAARSHQHLLSRMCQSNKLGRAPSPLSRLFQPAPQRKAGIHSEPRTPPASPSPTHKFYSREDISRRGYSRRGGPDSTQGYGTAPPSPIPPSSPTRSVSKDDSVPRPRRTSAGATRLPRPGGVVADGTETRSEILSTTARPASSMSRILSSQRILRTPTFNQSPRDDSDASTVSHDFDLRRSSLDTPRNGRLGRAAVTERRISPSTDLSSRPASRVSQSFRRSGTANWASSTPRRRSASVDHDHTAPDVLGTTTTPLAHQGRFTSRPTHEWLGSRVTNMSKATSLVDGDAKTTPSRSRLEQREMNMSARLEASESRFSSVRSASEHSMSYFGLARRGTSASESGRQSVSTTAEHSPIGESPTFTLSSSGYLRDREAYRSTSVSTAPTSISSYASQDRDYKDREISQYRSELALTKERHATESSALLSALADSQRVTRVLRDENDILRSKLAGAEVEISRLARLTEMKELEKTRFEDGNRWRFATVERENEKLRREVEDLKTLVLDLEQAMTIRRARPSLSEHGDSLLDEPSGDDENDEQTAKLRFPSGPVDYSPRQTTMAIPNGGISSPRRYSATSSIFPIVPANMSMLLDDDDAGDDILGDHSSSSFSEGFHLSASERTPAPRSAHRSMLSVNSFRSTISAAPSANSSFTENIPGSPASLMLSPEHELHLKDMESLHLSFGDDLAEQEVD